MASEVLLKNLASRFVTSKRSPSVTSDYSYKPLIRKNISKVIRTMPKIDRWIYSANVARILEREKAKEALSRHVEKVVKQTGLVSSDATWGYPRITVSLGTDNICLVTKKHVNTYDTVSLINTVGLLNKGEMANNMVVLTTQQEPDFGLLNLLVRMNMQNNQMLTPCYS